MATIKELIAPYRYTERYVSINEGLEIAYLDEGEGDQVIIMIHGLATYIPAWYKNIAELQKHYRCVALDLPGYGKSNSGYYEDSMTFYAKVIAEFTAKLGLEKVILVGNSMGAHIAMTYALDYPDLVENMILLAPAGFETFTEDEVKWIKSVFSAENLMAAEEDLIRSNYAQNFYAMPEDIEPLIADRLNMRHADDYQTYCQTISTNVSGMLVRPVFKHLNQIDIPTQVVFGENDRLIPNRILHPESTTLSIAEAGTNELKNGQLIMLPECGHFMPFEKPKEVNQIIQDFLINQGVSKTTKLT
ncbi:MAG: alpha/beta hydrolase [Bacteroidota bacterium]